jgi:preprotein translocase subunit SecD
MSNLRWKIITILVVFAVFFGIGVYPILAGRYKLPAPQWLRDKQLKLGLDLKGGVQLVMRVETNDALRVKTEQDSGRLQEEMKRRSVPGSVTIVDTTSFRVDGVPPAQEAAFRQAAEQEAVDFERSPGAGGTHTFRMRPNIAQRLREEAVVQARQTIERRVNELGVTEPSIAQQGADQILVQLPGVSDVDRAKQVIGSPGMLELKLVEQGPAASREDLLRSSGGVMPANMEVLTGPGDAATGGPAYYLVRRVAAVTGQDLRGARVQLDENNMPAVGFTLNSSGAAAFARVTGENVGRFLAIVLDKTVQSAPRINSRIAADGQIAGGFTQEEAQDLALILRSGALPATLTYLQEQTIGPTLGADSIRSGVFASVAGLLLISAFMLIYYKLSGVNAIVALVFNLVILLGLMAYVGAVMTLPGIAGFVLTMGMGVDSNVLIFERIKEELEAQRGVRAAINAGFSRVFWTLVDTHTAALISAAFLFQFGTGPIRGFAVALFFGLLSNLFTSIFVSKTLFEAELANKKVASISI